MVEGLKAVQIRILTWGVYGLMAFLAVVTGWMAVQVTAMPKEYVQVARYETDLGNNKSSLSRIENKLDQLLMSRWEGK